MRRVLACVAVTALVPSWGGGLTSQQLHDLRTTLTSIDWPKDYKLLNQLVVNASGDQGAFGASYFLVRRHQDVINRLAASLKAQGWTVGSSPKEGSMCLLEAGLHHYRLAVGWAPRYTRFSNASYTQCPGPGWSRMYAAATLDPPGG
jgi:hypothetical protein